MGERFRYKNMSFSTVGLLILCLCAFGYTQGCVEAEEFILYHYYYSKKDIFLINNTLTYQDNEYFKSFSDGIELIPDYCPGGVEGLIAATKLFPNHYIVNLNVPDFYNFNYNYVSQHLIYGGDRNQSQHEVKACVIDFKNKDIKNITCNEKMAKSFSYPTVKLMSRNVKDHLNLLDVVSSFSGGSHVKKLQTTPNKLVILICDGDKRFNFKYNGIDIEFSSNCANDVKTLQTHLLAVVTPEPLETDYDILVPIILYKAPCYDENISKIDNYVITTKCDDYKHALLEFLNKMKWSRMAIISDNAPYSEKFEREVTALLKENQFAYTVEKCVETATKKCDFVEALKSLSAYDGRLFIANVNEENAQIIQEQASTVWKEENHLSSWIFRDFLFTRNTKKLGDIYSLYLEPSYIDFMIDYKLEYKFQFHQTQYKHSIIEAIQVIYDAYKKMKHEYIITERKTFFRKLTILIREWSVSSRVTASVVKNAVLDPSFANIIIRDGKAQVQRYETDRRDDINSCNLKTSNFHKPCDDNNILYIMIVLVVVASCGLAAAICYNNIDNIRRRYSNLQ